MPRMLTPLGLISRRTPQIFSLGECKLTMTTELGFMSRPYRCLDSVYRPGFVRLPAITERVTKQPTPEALESFRGGLVSVIQPSESVPQVAFRGYFEAKPTLAGDARICVHARVSAGFREQGRRHASEPQNKRRR